MSSISERTENIAAAEFLERVKKDPSWAKDLDHPVIVRQYVGLSDSDITHLSRWLRFSGKDDYGESATFCRCRNLENAEGTYDGSVDFSLSGIKKIGRLKVLGTDRSSISAYFYKCHNLKTLTGSYYGPVVANESAIEKIENLKISKSNRDGEKLDLSCTVTKEIDEYSKQYIKAKEITWDEHIDDTYKEAITNCLNQSPVNQELNPTNNIVEDAKGTIVRTLAQAIGADDILAQKNLPITNPKRRWFLRKSTLITALIALFLYKTGAELTKQVLIDPTVDVIKRTPELIINWSDPKDKIQSKTIWPHEFSPAIERYAKSGKTEEDKLNLAKDTMLIMGLKPHFLVLDGDNKPPYTGTMQINNSITPVNIGKQAARKFSNEVIAQSALQSLYSFEEIMPDIAQTEINVAIPDFSPRAIEEKETQKAGLSKKMVLPIAVGID